MLTTKSNAEFAFELGKSIAELRIQVRQRIQVKIKEHNLNITFEMLEVLGCLWREDGTNQQEIADLTLRDKSSMTYLIDNLVKRNLVKRIEDENDRRNKLIYLTDGANALKDQIYPWAMEAYEIAAEAIDADAIKAATLVINKMIQNVKGV